MVRKGYNRCIYFLIAISFTVSILYLTTFSYESIFAQKDEDDDEIVKMVVGSDIVAG